MGLAPSLIQSGEFSTILGNALAPSLAWVFILLMTTAPALS